MTLAINPFPKSFSALFARTLLHFIVITPSFLLAFSAKATDDGLSAHTSAFLTPVTPSTLSWQQQESVHLHYDLVGETHHFPYNVPADIDWQISPTQYKVKLEISQLFLGTKTQISQGDVLPKTGITPQLFIDKFRSEDQVVFNRTRDLLEYSSTSTTEHLEHLEPFAQDQLSVTFQLGFWIAQNFSQLLNGATMTVQLVAKNHFEMREFKFIGSETLTLAIGKVDTFKIVRLPRSDDDQHATVWLLKNHGLTLGRLLLEEKNGDFIDQKLSQLDLIPGLKLAE